MEEEEKEQEGVPCGATTVACCPPIEPCFLETACHVDVLSRNCNGFKLSRNHSFLKGFLDLLRAYKRQQRC